MKNNGLWDVHEQVSDTIDPITGLEVKELWVMKDEFWDMITSSLYLPNDNTEENS